MKLSSPTKLELLVLGAVLVLAAWLRFDSLDQAEFLWDQAEISRWALNMGQQGDLTWIGPWSSTRLDTFPGAIWLLSIPYAISTNPVIATGFVAAINLLTVIGSYILVRSWFGRPAALVATLLFAVSPWAVIYSRKIWHTELLPPFVLLYVVTGWFAFVRGRRWAAVAHPLALAALVQLHFTGLAFVPLTVVWALFFFRRLDWRAVPLGILLAALTFVPYFVVDSQKDWQNVQRFFELMDLPSAVDADATRATWVMTTGTDLKILTGPDRYGDFEAETRNLRQIFPVLGVLAMAGVALAIWRTGKQARKGLDDETAAVLLAATWLVTPAAFFTRHNTIVAPHYFTVTLPAGFILIGWLFSIAWRWSKKRPLAVRGLLVTLVVFMAGALLYEVASALRFVWSHDTRWGYGTPIKYEMQAVDTATRLVQEMGGGDVIVLAEGDEPRMYEMPAAADILMYEQPHRSVDIRTALVIPASAAAYWATYDVMPGERLLSELTPELVHERIWLREGARSFRFYRWPGGEPDLPNLKPLPGGAAEWANGAELIGYRLSGDLKPGGAVGWTLVWRANETPLEDVYYHWFNHLVDDQGVLESQSDGPSVLPAAWRVGDVVLNWFEIPIPPDAPPGDYTVRVGMYVYPDLVNVPIRDAENGQQAGEWVEIGPISIGP